jgi:hypothetical protein
MKAEAEEDLPAGLRVASPPSEALRCPRSASWSLSQALPLNSGCSWLQRLVTLEFPAPASKYDVQMIAEDENGSCYEMMWLDNYFAVDQQNHSPCGRGGHGPRWIAAPREKKVYIYIYMCVCMFVCVCVCVCECVRKRFKHTNNKSHYKVTSNCLDNLILAMVEILPSKLFEWEWLEDHGLCPSELQFCSEVSKQWEMAS